MSIPPPPGFQPATLLPPSLTDNTYHSQTLPSRGKFSSRRRSEATKSLVFDDDDRPSPTAARPVKPDHSPPNTRYTPQSLLSQLSQPKIPPSSTSVAVVETLSETDGGKSDCVVEVSPGVDTNERTSGTAEKCSPITLKYGGKTPVEIVTSALKNRRSAGSLKKTMSMYQESRKQLSSSRLKLSTSDREEPGKQSASGEGENRLRRPHTVEAADRISSSASECVHASETIVFFPGPLRICLLKTYYSSQACFDLQNYHYPIPLNPSKYSLYGP